LELAPSTIAFCASDGLDKLGISCRPRRVHPLLMLAAKAARDHDLSVLGSSNLVLAEGASLRVIGIVRPDAGLSGLLPKAELAVIRRVVEGHCHEDIARERGTSVRTVANQIAAVFRRLCVSGRNDLVHRLFAESALKGPTLPLLLPTPDWAELPTAASLS
jgi:DNA-binding CsgD family transcriptional regulator